jgi:molecular chaperone DnaK
VKDLEEALKGKDLEDIKAKKEALNTVAQNLATKAYQQAQQAQQEQAGADEQPSNQDDSVVDADFEEVD